MFVIKYLDNEMLSLLTKSKRLTFFFKQWNWVLNFIRVTKNIVVSKCFTESLWKPEPRAFVYWKTIKGTNG